MLRCGLKEKEDWVLGRLGEFEESSTGLKCLVHMERAA
jgi:hypothetical protein